MPDDVPAPQVVPWYKSNVLRSLLAILVTQLINRVQQHYHVDVSVLGLNVNDIVSWLMDAISAGAIGVAAHARVAMPLPAVTLTKGAAQAANAPVPSTPKVTP